MSTSSECSLLPLTQCLHFKSGSLSKPSTDPLSGGDGVFEWPSGLQYIGEYMERKRHGYGVQLWPSGAKYEGYFQEDQRHGSGRHIWENEEEYEGEYQNDKKHGLGTYRWPNGAHMTGRFRQDCKEGHCVYVSAYGEKFEGMYHGDVRDGEGVLTYPGGRQDVGTWEGTKLVKLRFTVKEAYFDPASRDLPLKSPEENSLGSSNSEERAGFGPKGQLEVASEELIQAAGIGDVIKVTSLVKTGAIHVDVSDINGHTALFAAAIHCHPDVINVLLDNCADVNKLDVIGVTALNACHHILYCSTPQVRALLKLLPRLEYTLSHTSPPLSTTLTDCTLHTSDFMSTPHSSHTSHPSHTPCSHGHHHDTYASTENCSDCKSLCGIQLSHNTSTSDLKKVRSYPLLASHNTKKVKFRSLSDLSIEQEQRLSNRIPENQSREKSKSQNNTSFAENEPIATFNMGLAIVEQPVNLEDNLDHLYPPSSRPMSSLLDSALGHLNVGYSATASVNSDILGVSIVSTDFLSPSARFPNYGVRAISQESSPSQESLHDVSLATEPPEKNDETTTCKTLNGENPDKLETHSQLPSKTSPPLLMLPNQLQSVGFKSPLVSSGVFSSTQYGPIVSAAQSTTLSCGSGSLVECSTLSDITEDSLVQISERSFTVEETIDVLLKRGADPNASSLPVTSLLYAIRSGDVQTVERLAERGADVNQTLPLQVGGGHSPLMEAISLVGPNPVYIVEVLLKHGALVNMAVHACPSTTDISSSPEEASESGLRSRNEPYRVDDGATSVECSVLAGQNEGEGRYTPLHIACSRQELSDTTHEELSSIVLAMVDLLLGAGASVNVVAMGHSPLSLAIINGHDKVVERLLRYGGDPNLPLGAGVGTALCSLTTHQALKWRDATNSLKMVGELLQHGASFTQPVRVTVRERVSSVTDFAHAAFKEDKKLSCLKYSALNKSERARYTAWKKLLDNFVNLFKCRALFSIALTEYAWVQVQIDAKLDSKLKLQMIQERPSSAIHFKLPSFHKRTRHIRSAGGVPCRRRGKAELLPAFPLHTLSRALKKVTKHYGPTLDGGGGSKAVLEVETAQTLSPKKAQDKRLLQLKDLFGSALEMFRSSTTTTSEGTASHTSAASYSPPKQEQWTLSCFCYACGRSGVRLVKCPGCCYLYYCSQACRVEGYKRGHKEECSGGFVKQNTKRFKTGTT